MESKMNFLYRLRNWRAELHMLFVEAGVFIARMCGVLTAYGTLSATLIKADGSRIELGAIGKRYVTDDGVAFLVDDWEDGSQSITNMNYHDSGIGVAGEDQTDNDLGTPAGPTTRATGTKSQPSANILRSIGTIAYSGTLAITEHGLFSTSARATVEMWDRTVFSAINVESGDSIQFTYDCTLTAGS
jgi:hypothetical protein